MKNILKIAEELAIPEAYISPYGWDKAKISRDYIKQIEHNKPGKLVLVTAITPTKAGEGKTTTTIGLHDGLRAIGVKSLACLREPSLGPCFGIKGGAVGALKSTIVPEDDINLHFTGDFHALTSAINLIAAVVDNHIWQGNELNINPDRIVWPRALDMNDRALREILVNVNDKKVGHHKSEFVITVASELMSILTLSTSEEDFLRRVDNIIVAYTYDDVPVYLREFKITGAILKLMNQALNPNLVQTLEENPVLVHAGPFANISIGTNSIIATKMALQMADVVVTEAGFGGDLGAEKFLDIKCQLGKLNPSAIVLVATVRALKLHGGVLFEDLETPKVQAVMDGLCNLQRHAENIKKYNLPVVIAINRFPSDTDEEIGAIKAWCRLHDFRAAVNTAALEGGIGGIPLAKQVIEVLEEHHIPYTPIYALTNDIKHKISAVCTEIYRADSVQYSELAEQQIARYIAMGYDSLPVCIAKTPNSFTDNPKLLGAPKGFTINIREVRLYAGAGLIVPLTGDIMVMPGLPKVPRAVNM